MPRWASRINLEVKAVRVERVQDIKAEDALAEGVNSDGNMFMDYQRKDFCRTWSVRSFQSLWDSINAKRGYAWDTNPWVWVVEFARVQEFPQ